MYIKKIFCILTIVFFIVFTVVLFNINYYDFDERQIKVYSKVVDMTEPNIKEIVEYQIYSYNDIIDFNTYKIIAFDYYILNDSKVDICFVKQIFNYELLENNFIEVIDGEQIVEGVVEIDSKQEFSYRNFYAVPKEMAKNYIENILSRAISQISYEANKKNYITVIGDTEKQEEDTGNC